MPLYDLENGCRKIDGNRFYSKFIKPIANSIDRRSFEKMIRTIDTEICGLRPSEKSTLTWTKCAALIGYESSGPTGDINHLWDKAFAAVKGHPDECRKFVGSIIMWRISLLEDDSWLSSKTYDAGKIHPYRTYWINNEFVSKEKKHTIQDLANKFNKEYV